MLQRLVQKYLAADKLYRANIPSGEVEADTQENVMLLYMANNQATTKKGKSDPPGFKSVPAAFLLRGCPKFSAKIGGPTAPNPAGGAGGPGGSSSRSGCVAVAGGQVGRVVDGEREVGERDGGEEATMGEWGGGRGTDERRGGGGSGAPAEIQEGVAALIPSDSPSARRPAGAKRQKLADGKRGKSDLAVVAVAKSMAEVKNALEASSARKASLAGMALEAKLVEMLQDGPDKQERDRDPLHRTQQINQAQASGQTLGEGGGGGVRGTAAAVERSSMDVSEERGAARGKESECDESGPARDGPV